MASFSTHTVFNQVPPLEDYSLYETDPALRAAVRAKARRPGRATSPPMAPGSGGRRRWPPGTRPTAIRPG